MLHERITATARVLWARLATSLASARPACHSVLHEIPLEILVIIVEELSPLDCMLLAQTCSQLRKALHSLRLLTTTCLTFKDNSELLARIGRDNPNVWACEQCHVLHKFHPQDIPSPKSFHSWSSRGAIHRREGPYSFTFWPRHRHVQMALKLHRQEQLTKAQERYSNALVRRLYFILHASYSRTSLRGCCEVIPKIVERRFLLKIVQYVEDPEWESSTRPLLCGVGETRFKVCEHQTHCQQDLRESPIHKHRRREQARRGMSPVTEELLPNEEIETAVEMAFTRRGEVCEHSCARCPTDFTVQIWQKSAVLCVWADLGGETSIADEIWEVRRIRSPRSRWSYRTRDPVKHKPGRIRDLYESTT